MVYNDLVKQYDNLSSDLKNYLLVYKSYLGVVINSLDTDDNLITDAYLKYKMILDDPKNIFMKMTVFKDISFDDEFSFRESLLKVRDKILTIPTLSINNDITVYRTISIPNDEEISDISKSELISTSTNINTCLKFLIQKDNYKHYLFQLNLEENSQVLVCPYRITYNEKENRLLLTKNNEQEEIILNKNDFSFIPYDCSCIKIGNNLDVNVILLNGMSKKNIIKH